jgi:hypothetical protein
MVTRNPGSPPRLYAAQYSLLLVHELASRDMYVAATSRVQNQIDSLGYGRVHVCECLCKLTKDHYKHSDFLDHIDSYGDIYSIKFRGPKGVIDELYIKLIARDGTLAIGLFGFHL